jgi:hypothetical protein
VTGATGPTEDVAAATCSYGDGVKRPICISVSMIGVRRLTLSASSADG